MDGRVLLFGAMSKMEMGSGLNVTGREKQGLPWV